jgi:hypothetical protein
MDIVELSFSRKNQQMKPALCLKAAAICEIRHATKKFRVGAQIPMTSETPCGVTWQGLAALLAVRLAEVLGPR